MPRSRGGDLRVCSAPPPRPAAGGAGQRRPRRHCQFEGGRAGSGQSKAQAATGTGWWALLGGAGAVVLVRGAGAGGVAAGCMSTMSWRCAADGCMSTMSWRRAAGVRVALVSAPWGAVSGPRPSGVAVIRPVICGPRRIVRLELGVVVVVVAVLSVDAHASIR